MNKYVQRLILFVAVLSAVCTAAPVNAANKHLQLLARDTAATAGIVLPQDVMLEFSLAAEGTQVNYSFDTLADLDVKRWWHL